MQLDFPFHLDARGRIAETTEDLHIQQMIEQLLFTSPGERVNRPTFGCGLVRLVFAPASEELATAARFLVQGELQQWLGSIIQVETVDILPEDDRLQVTIQYVVRRNQRRVRATFEKRGQRPWLP
jgi:phage baseplate assembly protein W